jgi:hypothetical protein
MTRRLRRKNEAEKTCHVAVSKCEALHEGHALLPGGEGGGLRGAKGRDAMGSGILYNFYDTKMLQFKLTI